MAEENASKRRGSTLICALLLLFAGCQPSEPPPASSAKASHEPAPPPPIDLSTPDRALKSYWARKDWYKGLIRDAVQKFENTLKLPRPPDVYGPITSGDALAYWGEVKLDEETNVQRDIDTVKQETDSRAVALVRIKNITPIPEGAQPSARQFKEREAGIMFRYVLEREGNSWKVAEVWINSDLMGWRKLTEKRPPLYPSSVYSD